MKKQQRTSMGVSLRAIAFAIGRHYSVAIICLFALVVAGWGYIFWSYGYQAVFEEPVVRPSSITIKAGDLEALLRDKQERAMRESSITGRVFSNPFKEPPKPTP